VVAVGARRDWTGDGTHRRTKRERTVLIRRQDYPQIGKWEIILLELDRFTYIHSTYLWVCPPCPGTDSVNGNVAKVTRLKVKVAIVGIRRVSE